MSGSKRQSNYRKSVTAAFLEEDTIPAEGEQIVKVCGNRGSGIFEVETSAGIRTLATLPNKFRNLIWIKTGDYVLVYEKGDEEDSKEKYVIKNIFNKNNIKFLKRQQLWTFPEEEGKRDKLLLPEMEDIMGGYGAGEAEALGSAEEEGGAQEVLLDKMGNTIEPNIYGTEEGES